MSYFDAIILGILQGLTEFLPVSSSGHLVLGQALLKVKQPGVAFEVIVHLGTLVSVLVYFRDKIVRLIRSMFDSRMAAERTMLFYLIIGTVPAAVAGLLFKDFFEQLFSAPAVTSGFLLLTGLILLSTRFRKPGNQPMRLGSAIAMGIGQAIAILPGVSRSGTTISTGIWAGARPSDAAEFSFLLSIPAVGGAVILETHELLHIDQSLMGPYLVGALFSFAFGILAVSSLLAVIRRGKFEYFAYYCFAVGLLGLYIFLT
ncbi:MAG: undecaprenyl-diphosphate phosphatase [candidate division Zixibacteria bacterium]|nr:undecaprenyl-diphosphate phosphatase [candidate division Zixibacteria bacterium]